MIKKIQKPIRKIIKATRRSVAAHAPQWMHRWFGPTFDYFDMLILDHGILRVFYSNRHKVAEGVWRASQPTPHQVRYFSKQGIRTIVNLRGERECGGYRLEKKSCQKYGIELVNLTLSSRYPPTRERIHEAKKLFETIEHPFMMHCKSGADRAGLASVLYLLLHEDKNIEVAKEQLSLKYGHIKQAETGVLDYIFECYMESKKQHDISFIEWVDRFYDPKALKRNFESNAWANRLVNTVLQRE